MLLKSRDNNQLEKIKNSINQFTAALADGYHIETERLEGLMQIWKSYFKNCKINNSLATIIDNEIKNFIAARKIENAKELQSEDKLNLCNTVANHMTDCYKVDNISEDVLKETINEAIQLLSLKEAWLYRDWQDAIGDYMLKNNIDNSRKYDVIGYYEFYNRLQKNNNENDKYFISKIENIFIDLDITGSNKFDTRVNQVKNITRTCSKLMLALTNQDPKRKVLMSKTIELANNLKNIE